MAGAHHAMHRAEILRHLQSLREPGEVETREEISDGRNAADDSAAWEDLPDGADVAADIGVEIDAGATTNVQICQPISKKRRSHTPSAKAEKLYTRWKLLLPSLVDPVMEIQAIWLTGAQPLPLSTECVNLSCSRSQRNITFVSWNSTPLNAVYVPTTLANVIISYTGLDTRAINICQCFNGPKLHINLIRHGYFPPSPTTPRVTISIELLDFYMKLHASSGDAITGVAAALKDLYAIRGIRAVETNVRTLFVT